MNKFIRKIPSILIVCFWVIMTGLLIAREYLPKHISPQNINFPIKLPYQRTWGVIENNPIQSLNTNDGATKSSQKARKRLGFLDMNFTRGLNTYIWNSKIDVTFFQDMNILINSSTMFDQDKKLRDFRLEMSSGEYLLNLEGSVKGNMLRIAVKSDSEEKIYKFPWERETDILNNGLLPFVFMHGLKEGDKFNWYVLNPITRHKELVKAVVSRATFYYNKANFVPVLVLNMNYQDISFEFWIDENGEPLKVHTPWGWDLEAE